MPWWDPGADASVDPESDTVLVGAVEVGRGSRVVLRRGTAGPTPSTCSWPAARPPWPAVFHDVDEGVHLAVTVDDDPGADLKDSHGRYLYFAPDEVEPLRSAAERAPAMSRILVACVGNIFRSDDGFGVEVAGRLAGAEVPEGTRIEDFGIRSVHLAYELMEGYDVLRARRHGGPAGRAARLALPDRAGPGVAPRAARPASFPQGPVDAHDLPPGGVLSLLPDLGGQVGRVLVVGCRPETLDDGHRAVAGGRRGGRRGGRDGARRRTPRVRTPRRPAR